MEGTVKINALVDEGIVEIVSILNEVEGLKTLGSCQGELAVDHQESEAPAYVYFHFGDWETISRFAFNVVAPALAELEVDTSVMIDVFNNSDPMGKIQIRTSSAIPVVAAALQKAIRHKSLCSYGKERKAPHNSTRDHSRLSLQPSYGEHAICLD